MRRQRNVLGEIAGLAGILAAVGCGNPCLDDGFGGADCAMGGTGGVTASGPGSSVGNTGSLDGGTTTEGSSSVSHGMTSLDGTSSGSGSTVTATATDTGDTSTSDGGTTVDLQPFCLDADGDGFADLDSCVDADPADPPPDHIPPGALGDCDDTSPEVFPGAAANEPELCTLDADADGWGSSMPPPGVDAGSDCDDGSPFTFPGAAQLEAPPLDVDCLRDQDDDGWGDEAPPPGVTPGSDCVDDDPTIAPAAAANEPMLCTVDADGDGWGDWNAPGLDPAADEGSDCDDADPLVERCALLVTQDGTASAPLDAALVPALQSLGLTVLLGEDVLVTAASADPAVLVVVSTSSFSFEVANKLHDVDEGAVVLEGYIWGDMDMSPSPSTSTNMSVSILDPAHPIAAGLGGTVGFMQAGTQGGLFRTAPGPGAQLIASRVTNASHIVVFAFDEGAVMQNGFVAPGRRVGFGANLTGGGGSNGQLAASGLAMFTAAAAWAID